MGLEVTFAILCGLAIIIGCLGIIVPVLPGSILILISGLVWAIVAGGTFNWIAFGIIGLCSATGMVIGWVLTGRRMKEQEIPNRSVFLGALVGVVGFFVIPVLGLILGFILGLYLAEYSRLKESRAAWASSVHALKALGVGILVEFCLAVVSLVTFTVSLVHTFTTAGVAA